MVKLATKIGENHMYAHIDKEAIKKENNQDGGTQNHTGIST